MIDDDRREALIRDRAFVISQGPDSGTPEENWFRAEREIAREEADELRRETVDRGREVAYRTALTHP
ncbi:MAG: hypothetical protein ACRC50_09765 [Gaiella sp.]